MSMMDDAEDNDYHATKPMMYVQ